jgi:hypothetical protein
MAKEELIEMHGPVDEVPFDSRFRVTLDNGQSWKLIPACKPHPHPDGDRSLSRRPTTRARGDHLPAKPRTGTGAAPVPLTPITLPSAA